MNETIYLDYAATTPTASEVAEVMHECQTGRAAFANAASNHVEGRKAATAVAKAREQVASLLRTDPVSLIWTSGASESDNIAIQGVARARAHRGKHLITMPTEHKAVVDSFRALEQLGFEVTWLTPAEDGLLPIDALSDAIREDTQLVSVMHVNNETGIVQDINEIGSLCRAHDVTFHCDAAQSVGKLDIDLQALPVDLLSFSAHKFYGPQGIGGLYVAPRPKNVVAPLMFGGGQERRLRPGTLPVAQIAGVGQAASLAAHAMQQDARHVQAMNERLWQGIHDLPGVVRNGAAEHCYAGILNVSMDGVAGESLMLSMEPVCVASGSACNSTSGESSYVLRALGCSDHLAQSAMRFSFGRPTTVAEVDTAIARYRQSVAHLRSIAPTTTAIAQAS